MILVDTSVWIDFFRCRPSTKPLVELLESGLVQIHPWVLAELRLGHLGPRRQSVLQDLERLEQVDVSRIKELSDFIEKQRLFGKGLSLVDCELLYSTMVSPSLLWTHDKQLEKAAKSQGTAFYP